MFNTDELLSVGGSMQDAHWQQAQASRIIHSVSRSRGVHCCTIVEKVSASITYACDTATAR